MRRTAEERQIQDQWIRHEALARDNQQALRQIEGKEPLDREHWLFEFGGELHRQTSWLGLLWDGLTAPEYPLVDVFKLKAGVNFTARNLKYGAVNGALRDEITNIGVPVYFFTGRYDHTDPVEWTERYCDGGAAEIRARDAACRSRYKPSGLRTALPGPPVRQNESIWIRTQLRG